MLYYVNVDPVGIKMNREMHVDRPTCTVQAEDWDDPLFCHGVFFPGASELKYFREGERDGLGAHVSIVVYGPIRYMTRNSSGLEQWYVLD